MIHRIGAQTIPWGENIRENLGEIVQWAGWALATWSAAGLAFCSLTIANLAPRARSNQRWYRSEFPDYPHDRRALIPYLW